MTPHLFTARLVCWLVRIRSCSWLALQPLGVPANSARPLSACSVGFMACRSHCRSRSRLSGLWFLLAPLPCLTLPCSPYLMQADAGTQKGTSIFMYSNEAPWEDASSETSNHREAKSISSTCNTSFTFAFPRTSCPSCWRSRTETPSPISIIRII